MRYQFPEIRHINDVLPALADRDEFIVASRDGYQVVNYMVMREDTFPPVTNSDLAMRREARGLIFDEAGNIIARRYHKFKNVGEAAETLPNAIDWSQPHRILEKLDGSMVSPFLVRGHLRWATKMGITDVAMQAETHASRRPQYVDFSRQAINDDWTPIFEWCSRQSRIVIDYPEDQLILTGMRHLFSGEYMDYDTMVGLGQYWHIPVVVAHDISEDLIRTVAAWEGSEGVVVRFDDGHMVKIKAEQYVLQHRSKDAITREKNVLDYVINDRVDDILPYLHPEDQQRLLEFQDAFWRGVDNITVLYKMYVDGAPSRMDRKTWAMNEMPNIKETIPHAPAVVFGWYDGRDIKETVVNIIRKNISTRTKIDTSRYLWGNISWSYTFNGDE